MCEVDDDAIARSELYVDTRAGALGESGEILGAIARDIIDHTAVRAEFSDLAAGLFKRSTSHAITIFKSVGTALEDLVAAELALGANQNRAEREPPGFAHEP
jgi:ornithine cyclodeaminase/alanine dehydrogenase-like protein (mu-crystallin family)